MTPKLFVSKVILGDTPPKHWLLFLHGILGSGANWRSFARSVLQDRPEWGAVLVDLRMHGQSQDFAPPHTVQSCAEDLIESLQDGSVNAVDAMDAVDVVVGHSFGGKVALEYLALRERLGIPLRHVVTVDSNPGIRDEGASNAAIMTIISALETLPIPLLSREQFSAHLRSKNIAEHLIAWLMMNVRPIAHSEQLELRLQLPAIRALLADYFTNDAWHIVESSDTALTLVIGGLSPSYTEQDRVRARQIAELQKDRVRTQIFADAGHWVHVDAPAELARTVEFAVDTVAKNGR